ncbi:conserved hypothetical protein [Catenulispora acidiphila DSM 44928]|uniref:DUF4351 domain-containing protein n=2 Tax=Catenulispora TaxID=414878 RepID=C7PVN6_CATAD|nr:conserved hypothetical protein [Catenulispora acidiphila DSM 44928]
MAMDLSFYRSPFSRQLRAEGHAEGVAEGVAEGRIASLHRILNKRGIFITEEQRVQLYACTDLDQLDAWLDRAAIATQASEVFDAG